MVKFAVNNENQWRLTTPGAANWAKSARPGSANKYFIVSADTHISPPHNLFTGRIETQYVDRLPKVIVDDKGDQYLVAEGARPAPILRVALTGEDQYRQDL